MADHPTTVVSAEWIDSIQREMEAVLADAERLLETRQHITMIKDAFGVSDTVAYLILQHRLKDALLQQAHESELQLGDWLALISITRNMAKKEVDG